MYSPICAVSRVFSLLGWMPGRKLHVHSLDLGVNLPRWDQINLGSLILCFLAITTAQKGEQLSIPSYAYSEGNRTEHLFWLNSSLQFTITPIFIIRMTSWFKTLLNCSFQKFSRIRRKIPWSVASGLQCYLLNFRLLLMLSVLVHFLFPGSSKIHSSILQSHLQGPINLRRYIYFLFEPRNKLF